MGGKPKIEEAPPTDLYFSMNGETKYIIRSQQQNISFNSRTNVFCGNLVEIH